MESDNAYPEETASCPMKSRNGYCPKPLEQASSFLSKKWAISIIITIGNFEHLRFKEVQARIKGITAKTLTDRLRELEREGVLRRKVYQEIPPRVEYSLTEKGVELRNALKPLMKWCESIG